MKVGFTGHQDLGSSEAFTWTRTALSEVVSKAKITSGYTSLAAGADQLFAQVLLDQKISLIAVIPSQDYINTFSDDEHIGRYKELLAAADNIIRLERDFANEEAFYEAGKKVVDLTDFMIAVWNAKKAKGLGGTGDIVEYALAQRKKIIHLNPLTREVRTI